MPEVSVWALLCPGNLDPAALARPKGSRILTSVVDRFRLVLFTSVLAMALLVIVGAGAARAATTTTIDGEPLDIHLGDQGNVQVLQLGQNSYSFYPSDETYGDAGFFIGFLARGDNLFGPPIRARRNDDDYQPPAPQSPVTGAGTAANPLQQVTIMKRRGSAEVTQTTTYVNGARSFKQRFDVNASRPGLQYRASTAADLYLEGSDSGVGFFIAGAAAVRRRVERSDRPRRRAARIRFPWSAYQELPLSADLGQRSSERAA